MDTQQRRDEQADTSQNGVQEVQQRRQEHKQEFQRLGYAGQKRGDRDRQQHTAHHRTTFFRRGEIHRQSGARQTKHHDREEAGHKHPRRAVASIEAVDVAVEYSACGIGEFANLEPGDGVQYLMQTGGDQQTVDEAKDTGTQRACGNDPFTARMDAMLYRRPDVTENSGQHQTEKARCDRHKTFSTEETEKIRQFDTRPAIINRAADQTGNNPRQHAHVDFRVNRHHRFGHDEVTHGSRQCCRACAIFRPTGGHADSENQRQVIENRPARLRDKRHIQQIWLAESQQQRCHRQHDDRELQRPTQPLEKT
ncbi:Uncharacterised protein [Salmonella enterica subsp. enterica serovar Typhi]|nr:Uncharacterised protein [Salmonella enterica subsp. enterica serovar Typhi]